MSGEIKLAFLILSFVFMTGTRGAADPVYDQALPQCIRCHMAVPDDDSKENFPSLGGQSTQYMFNAMKAYQTGTRKYGYSDFYMGKRLKSMSDVTIQALANYFAGTPIAPATPGDPAIIAAGKQIYTKGNPATGAKSCIGCHGVNGEGDEEIPRVAGQWQWYTYGQMNFYKAGTIKNQDIMSYIAGKLSDAEITAVTTYMQSL